MIWISAWYDARFPFALRVFPARSNAWSVRGWYAFVWCLLRPDTGSVLVAAEIALLLRARLLLPAALAEQSVLIWAFCVGCDTSCTCCARPYCQASNITAQHVGAAVC